MSKKYRLLTILLSVLLVFSGWGGLLPEQLLAADDDQPDLFFSEYIEGSGQNKALEIYNPTNEAITFNGNYSIQIFSNGSTSANSTIGLSGTINPKGVFVIANSHADVNEAISNVANQSHGSINFNGNDAIVLRRGNTVLDQIGKVGENLNPTKPDGKEGEWISEDENGGMVSTRNMTLIRKPSISSGDPDLDNDFEPHQQWIALPTDTFIYLGNRDFPSYQVTFLSGLHGSLEHPDPNVYSIDVEYGKDAVAPNVIADAGYQFDGWDKSFTKITAPRVLTAEYIEIPGAILFFSEYIEGRDNNKAIEIFNYSDHPVSLSGYSVQLYVNDNTNPSNTINLSNALGGVLNSKSVLVVAHDKAHADILSVADIKDAALTFNGNDSVVLVKDGIIIDSIGQAGTNPGKEWKNYGVSTLDMGVRTKSWTGIRQLSPNSLGIE